MLANPDIIASDLAKFFSGFRDYFMKILRIFRDSGEASLPSDDEAINENKDKSHDPHTLILAFASAALLLAGDAVSSQANAFSSNFKLTDIERGFS